VTPPPGTGKRDNLSWHDHQHVCISPSVGVALLSTLEVMTDLTTDLCLFRLSCAMPS
jgi:hypothetical protein